MPPPGISPNSPLPTPHFIYPEVLESMLKARQLDLKTDTPSPIPLFSLSTIASATFSGHTSVTVDIPKKTADTSTIAIVTNLPTSLPPPPPPAPPPPPSPDAPATPTMGQPQTSFSSSNLPPPPPTSVPAPDAILNTPPPQAQPGSDSPPNVIPNTPPPQVQPDANNPQDVPPSGPGGSQPHLGQPNTNNSQHPTSNNNAPASSQSGPGFGPGSSADTKSQTPGSSTSQPPLSPSRDQSNFTSREAQQPKLGSETTSSPSPSIQSPNPPTQSPDEGTTNVDSVASTLFVAPSGATRNSNSARLVGQRLCKRTILMIVLASLLVL
ncbi:hypothetical protein ONZ45_g3468 [Pleurotus djamor]|nr:hypothetical protein ONZ45_g3468 [Pleurotus djamor]